MLRFVCESGIRFVTTSAGSPAKFIAPLKAAVIVVYHAMLRREAVDDSRVPVVQNGSRMDEAHDWGAGNCGPGVWNVAMSAGFSAASLRWRFSPVWVQDACGR
jgi:hypothetical protein